MDTPDNTEPTSEIPVLKLNDQSLIYLNEARRWGYFLSIMGFIGIGLMILAALFIGSIMNLLSAFSPAQAQFPTFTLTFIYLLLALIYFFPVLYLYRFSTKMKVALEQRNELDLMLSFSYLKSLFRFMGIMVIIILSIYLLVLLGILAAVFMRH